MVTESTVHVEVLGTGDSDLQLVLSLAVSNDFPVVDSTLETDISDDRSEHVGLLLQKDVGVIV